MKKLGRQAVDPSVVSEESRLLSEIWHSVPLKTRGGQAEFGEKYGIGSQSAVSQFLKGESSLSLKAAQGFARGLGCKIEDFSQRLATTISEVQEYTGSATANITLPGFSATATASNQAPALIAREEGAIYLIENVYPAEFSIPLLSWVRAGAFCEAPGQFTKDDAEELLPRPLFRTGPNTFALRVVGDSMDAPSGYREGEIVYIDPDIEPTPGKDVLAKADGKMTLKRYKVDEEGPYLLQLNGSRIIRPTGEWHVCGVVVFSGQRR